MTFCCWTCWDVKTHASLSHCRFSCLPCFGFYCKSHGSYLNSQSDAGPLPPKNGIIEIKIKLYGQGRSGLETPVWSKKCLWQTHTCMIEARLYGNCRSCWVRKAGWKHTVWKENNEGKVMDIPAAHNDAQGLSVMRSAPKLRPRTPMSGLVLPSCAQRRPWPAQAGTGTCVHIPIQLIPIASLAWLGKQQPCPLLFCNFLLGTEVDTHTHGLQGKVRNPKKSIPRKATHNPEKEKEKGKPRKRTPYVCPRPQKTGGP